MSPGLGVNEIGLYFSRFRGQGYDCVSPGLGVTDRIVLLRVREIGIGLNFSGYGSQGQDFISTGLKARERIEFLRVLGFGIGRHFFWIWGQGWYCFSPDLGLGMVLYFSRFWGWVQDIIFPGLGARVQGQDCIYPGLVFQSTLSHPPPHLSYL